MKKIYTIIACCAALMQLNAQTVIVNSDGTHSIVIGNGPVKTIVNSSGTHSLLIDHGGITKTLVNANGTHSTIIDHGGATKTIINADGTHSMIIDHGGATKTIINANGTHSTLFDQERPDKTVESTSRTHLTANNNETARARKVVATKKILNPPKKHAPVVKNRSTKKGVNPHPIRSANRNVARSSQSMKSTATKKK